MKTISGQYEKLWYIEALKGLNFQCQQLSRKISDKKSNKLYNLNEGHNNINVYWRLDMYFFSYKQGRAPNKFQFCHLTNTKKMKKLHQKVSVLPPPNTKIKKVAPIT